MAVTSAVIKKESISILNLDYITINSSEINVENENTLTFSFQIEDGFNYIFYALTDNSYPKFFEGIHWTLPTFIVKTPFIFHNSDIREATIGIEVSPNGMEISYPITVKIDGNEYSCALNPEEENSNENIKNVYCTYSITQQSSFIVNLIPNEGYSPQSIKFVFYTLDNDNKCIDFPYNDKTTTFIAF